MRRHGLHCQKRLSGRHETILWFTKSDEYTFNLDPVRVPSKYPEKKHFKGPNKGKISSNPLGKNPSDVWDIPNVKSNHVEKTDHPCQFPIGLVERLVLAYLFHIWKLPGEELTVMTVSEMSVHIPDDSGAGQWAQVEIEL